MWLTITTPLSTATPNSAMKPIEADRLRLIPRSHQVPLPIFDRNQGQIAAAQAQVMGAKDAVTDQEIAIRAEVASALSDYGSRRDALLKVLPRMAHQAAESDQIAV